MRLGIVVVAGFVLASATFGAVRAVDELRDRQTCRPVCGAARVADAADVGGAVVCQCAGWRRSSFVTVCPGSVAEGVYRKLVGSCAP